MCNSRKWEKDSSYYFFLIMQSRIFVADDNLKGEGLIFLRHGNELNIAIMSKPEQMWFNF